VIPFGIDILKNENFAAYISGRIIFHSVFRAGTDGMENVEKLRHRVREGVSRLRGLDMGDELSVEILSHLVEGKMTVSELVTRIYGLGGSEGGYHSCYNRVSREIRRLESKGLVSRQLFGRDKPYRLTRLAVANLARIGGEEQQQPVVTRTDLASYIATLALSLPHVLRTGGWIEMVELPTVVLLVLFCFSLGFSSSRLLQTLRRVF
jgi:hypothetical protein